MIMTKERFLNYSDAIVAIIITIMVLELPIPKEPTLAGLKQASLPFLAYFMSFIVIWAVWYNHHILFNKVQKVNARIYWYNGIWIFTMSLFPFATAWVGRNPNVILPELLYLCVISIWSISFLLMELELERGQEYVRNKTWYNTRYHSYYYLILASAAIIVWFWPIYVLLSVFSFTFITVITQLRGANINPKHPSIDNEHQ